jgi:hypothetical protein
MTQDIESRKEDNFSLLRKMLSEKIKEVSEQHMRMNSMLVSTNDSIEKLSKEKETAIANQHILNGANQAYSDVVKIMQSIQEKENKE